MKYFYFILIALVCIENSAMEPIPELKRTKTWKDLEDLTEPLLAEFERYKLTESDYIFVESELPKRIAEHTTNDNRVLHAVTPQSAIPNLTLETVNGRIQISAQDASVLEFPEAQSDLLNFIKENPKSALVKGKVTLKQQSYHTEDSLEIYTDFIISSIDLDRENTLLIIEGSYHNKFKMLIYHILQDFRLKKLKYFNTQSKDVLKILKLSFLLEHFKPADQSINMKLRRFFQTLFKIKTDSREKIMVYHSNHTPFRHTIDHTNLYQ